MSAVTSAGRARHRVLLLPMTDLDGGAHLMSEQAAVTGRRVGRYATLCGAVVLAASLTTPEQRICQRCVEIRHSWQDTVQQASAPRRSAWWRRRRPVHRAGRA